MNIVKNQKNISNSVSSMPTSPTSKSNSKIKEVVRRYKKSRSAMIGLFIFLLFIFIALFANLIATYEKGIVIDSKSRFQGISLEHPFGTDAYGRDMFTRVIHGSRYSLGIGLSAMMLSMLFGVPIGAIAGYYGGKVDIFIMRIIDTVTSIPAILLSLVVVSVFGASFRNLILAIFVAHIPSNVRLVRSAVIPLVEQQYIEAARAGGAGDIRIILKHVLPNISSTIIVQATMSVSFLMLRASGLSFLGLGVPAPSPEWGTLLSEAKGYILSAPHMMIFPGLALVILALSINLVGDGLRDALDPRLKS